MGKSLPVSKYDSSSSTAITTDKVASILAIARISVSTVIRLFRWGVAVRDPSVDSSHQPAGLLGTTQRN